MGDIKFQAKIMKANTPDPRKTVDKIVLFNSDGSPFGIPKETDIVPLLVNGYTSTLLRAAVQDHIVTYEGDFTTPEGAANGQTIFTVPAALQPKNDITIGVFADDGSDYGVLRFEADGDVKVYGSLTEEKKYTLSGICVIDPWSNR